MSLFVCDNCDCVDNTALGHYWPKNIAQLQGFPLGTALCTECMPDKFADGSLHEGDSLSTPGKWHGRFPKEKWDGEEHVINRGKNGERL